MSWGERTAASGLGVSELERGGTAETCEKEDRLGSWGSSPSGVSALGAMAEGLNRTGEGPSPHTAGEGTAQGASGPTAAARAVGRQASPLGQRLPGSSRVLSTLFPGPFRRPVGDGSGRMEKADHFPGFRPSLEFAHSVETDPGVDAPGASTTDRTQPGPRTPSKRAAAGWGEERCLQKTQAGKGPGDKCPGPDPEGDFHMGTRGRRLCAPLTLE